MTHDPRAKQRNGRGRARCAGRAPAWLRPLATALLCMAALAATVPPGTARAQVEISGPEADRVRQQICPNDSLSTATHHRIFRDWIIVGRVGTTNEYGFAIGALGVTPSVGMMINSRYFDGDAEFPRAGYDDALSDSYRIQAITVNNGTLKVSLHKVLADADRAKLELRICGRTLKFADATENEILSAATNYTWTNVNNHVASKLVWSRLNLGSLYTGEPVMHPIYNIPSYGTVEVSLGVPNPNSPPVVTSATVTNRTIILMFDKAIADNSAIAHDAFSVRVGPISSAIDPVPTYTPERTVTNVLFNAGDVAMTLNAKPPQFSGNHKPGLLVSYTPPATNALTGVNGAKVGAFTDLVVTDNTADGEGTLVVMGATEVDPPQVTGTPTLSAVPQDGNWSSGDAVEVTVTFTEAVAVDTAGGTPTVTLQLGGTEEKSAGYLRGSGTTELVFGYTLTADDGSHSSMVLDQDSLALNGGTIRSRSTGLDAVLDHNGRATVAPPPVQQGSRSADRGEDASVTTAEDTAYTFLPSDFGFSDDAKRDRNSHITIATLPDAGALIVDGSAAAQHQIVDKTDIGTGALAFTPAADAHGDAYASFDFRSYNGRTESAAATMTVDVTPVNDDPQGAPGIAGEVEGEAVAGQTATATTSGLDDPDGMTNPDWSWRWLRVAGTVETAIEGATAGTYLLAAADAGNKIKVEVSWTDDGGTRETATSAAWPPEGSIAAAPRSEGENAEDAAVTAAFRNAPATHDGSGEFTVELHFSEEPPLSYKTVQGSLLAADNATVRGARRLVSGSNVGWEIRVRPDAAGDISLTLPVRPCGAANAICVDGAALGAPATATIAYAAPEVPETPLTARFKGMPTAHGGTAFTFELELSEDVPGLSYRTVGGSALSVTGGTVAGARRLVRGSNRRWEVRVTPGGLGDVTIALAATQDCSASGAICTPQGRKQSSATSATVAGPALSVADASVDEGSGAELAFTVTLGHAAIRAVSVDYATADGTAVAGEDYTATSGTLAFAAGETSKTVRVPVLDDALDEGEETMTFTLSDPSPSSVRLADAVATGTIANDDPLQKMWLSRFGRTVADHVTGAVSDRLAAPLTGAQVTVGGQTVNLAETQDDAWIGRTLTSLAQVMGAPQGPGAEGGPGSGGPWPGTGPGMAEGPTATSAPAREITGRELLLGSAFHLAKEGDGGTPGLAAWGRVTVGGFDGEAPADDGNVRIDGNATTGILGADAEWNSVLAGIAVSVSEGEGGFDLPGVDSGTVESTMTTVSPYARVTLTDRVSAWGLAGYGTGDLTVVQKANAETGQPERVTRSDLSMRLAAVGGRGALLRADESGGMDLALRADAFFVETTSEAVSNEGDTSADASRVRLALEGSRAFRMGEGVLTPGLELGLRHDGGDAETGTGVELGGRVSYADPETGFSVEGSVRALIAHEDSDYREWGASGALRLAPGERGRGLSFGLAPTYGAPGSGVDRLWSARDARGLAPGHGTFEPESRLEGGLGYGMALFGDRFTGTPNLGFGLSGAGARDYRLGWRLTSAVRGDSGFEVNLDATRREPANDNGAGTPAEHGVMLRAAIRW